APDCPEPDRTPDGSPARTPRRHQRYPSLQPRLLLTLQLSYSRLLPSCAGSRRRIYRPPPFPCSRVRIPVSATSRAVNPQRRTGHRRQCQPSSTFAYCAGLEASTVTPCYTAVSNQLRDAPPMLKFSAQVTVASSVNAYDETEPPYNQTRTKNHVRLA